MFKRLYHIFLLSLSAFLLAGCNLELLIDINDNDYEHNQAENEIVTAISDLQDTDHFRHGAVEHILEGELNKEGEAVGFHYNRLSTKKGEIIAGTETEANKFGVYEAEVIVNDVAKTSNHGKSTFFPNEWDTQHVIDAINEAYNVKTLISGNTYEGLTADGMRIRMYLDDHDKIISAFPVY